jgi:hypothetical protein
MFVGVAMLKSRISYLVFFVGTAAVAAMALYEVLKNLGAFLTVG